ncbi:MAG: hypothetical protein AAF242_15875, partial [Bacteroidota bacterium]
MRLFLLLLFLPFYSLGQEAIQLPNVLDTAVSIKSDLSEGVVIKDLSWAWSSNNACFVELQQEKFTGHHVFFEGLIPVRTEIKVTVIPDDPKADFSVYAFETAPRKDQLPPHLASCIRCEADYKWDRKKRRK